MRVVVAPIDRQKPPGLTPLAIFLAETHPWRRPLMYAVDYLNSRQIGYRTLLHRPASGGTKRAQTIHLPGHCVAKTVLVKSGNGFVLATSGLQGYITNNDVAAAGPQ